MAKLYIENEIGEIKVLDLNDREVTIGRKEDNVLCLPDKNVSRYHAKIFKINAKYFVEDVASRYGTRLNGIKILEKTEITPSDILQIGDYQLRVVEKDTAIRETDQEIETPMIRKDEIPLMEREETNVLSVKEIEKYAKEVRKRRRLIDEDEETEVLEAPPRAMKKLLYLGFGLLCICVVLVYAIFFTGTEIKEPVRKKGIINIPRTELKEESLPQKEEEKKGEEKSALVKVEPSEEKVEEKKVSKPEEKLKIKEEKIETPPSKIEKKEEVIKKKKEKLIAKVEKEKKKEEKKGEEEKEGSKKNKVTELYELARKSRLEGNTQKAIALLKECVRLNPGFATAYKVLGTIYASAGEQSEALKYYRKYLDLKPNAPDANAVKMIIGKLGGKL